MHRSLVDISDSRHWYMRGAWSIVCVCLSYLLYPFPYPCHDLFFAAQVCI